MRSVVWSQMYVYAMALSLSACSAESGNQRSGRVKTVLTTTPAHGEVLYWQEQNEIVRGNCPTNSVVTRSNCTLSSMRRAVSELSRRAIDRAQKELDLLNAAINDEMQTLTKDDVTVRSLNQQMDAVHQQKAALLLAIQAAGFDIQTDTVLIGQLIEQRASNDRELKAVEARLEVAPSDTVLLELHAALIAKRIDIDKKKYGVEARVAKNQRRIDSQKTILAKADIDLKERQAELERYLDRLDCYSPKLDQLRRDRTLFQSKMDAIPQVLSFIAKNDIMYRNVIWTEELKGALVFVNQAFSASLGLIPGTFKVESGFRTFCPQKTSVTISGDLDVVFLPPCDNSEKIHTCDKDVCNDVELGTSIVVRDETHYQFLSSGYSAGFVLNAAAVD